jgi:hypothetical protein
MSIQKTFVSFTTCCALVTLCSCADVGDKFSIPSTDTLTIGQMTPDQAVALFGKPSTKTEDVYPEGSYEVYKYTFAHADISAINGRVMLLEFKDGKLNGYLYWSSFDADKTRISLQNVDALKAGFGKLTKDDVVKLMGKPDAKTICPSVMADFRERCYQNTEAWGWYMTDDVNLWLLGPQKIKSAELYVTFDDRGKVSGVELTGENQPD